MAKSAGDQAPDITLEWLEPESSANNDRYKKLRLTGRKKYRAVKIRRDGKTMVCGLGDFAHLESGADDGTPFIARISALWEDSDGAKYAQVQWLYRKSDLASPPADCAENEVFYTAHDDANRLEVVIDLVKCITIAPDGRTVPCVQYGVIRKLAGVEKNRLVKTYVVKRTYDHNKFKLRQLTEEQVTAISKYSDETMLDALSLTPLTRKKSSDEKKLSPLGEKQQSSSSEVKTDDAVKEKKKKTPVKEETPVDDSKPSKKQKVILDEDSRVPTLSSIETKQSTTNLALVEIPTGSKKATPVSDESDAMRTEQRMVESSHAYTSNAETNETSKKARAVPTTTSAVEGSHASISSGNSKATKKSQTTTLSSIEGGEATANETKPFKQERPKSSNEDDASATRGPTVASELNSMSLATDSFDVREVTDKRKKLETHVDVVNLVDDDDDDDDDDEEEEETSTGFEELWASTKRNLDRQDSSKLDHAQRCVEEDCGCGREKSLIFHAKSSCEVPNCSDCASYLNLIRSHAARCQRLRGTCLLPNCEENKPSVWLEHSAGCQMKRCDVPLCFKLRALLVHANKCIASSCDFCADLNRFIQLHEFGCVDGRCRFPLCSHFSSALTHSRRRDSKCRFPQACLDCVLFRRISLSHLSRCDAELGACLFPLCKGRRQPVASERPEGQAAKRMRSVSKDQVRIGSQYQADLPRVTKDVQTSSELLAWSPITATWEQLVSKANQLLVRKLDRGDLVFVSSSGMDRQMMLVRVLTSQDSAGFFTCVPFDAAWPKDKDRLDSFSDLPWSLQCRFHETSLVISDSLLERAMASFADGDDKWPPEKAFIDLPRIVSLWTEAEYALFAECLRVSFVAAGTAGEDGWLNAATNKLRTKTRRDITMLYNVVFPGVANAPPGMILCTKCCMDDARHPCKRFYSCFNAICDLCFRGAMKAGGRDEIDRANWFCSSCCSRGKRLILQETTSTTSDVSSELVVPNDGYDDSVAWNGRSSRGGRTLTEGIQTLDEVLYMCSDELYSRTIDTLLLFGGRSASAEEVVQLLKNLFKKDKPHVGNRLLAKFAPGAMISPQRGPSTE